MRGTTQYNGRKATSTGQRVWPAHNDQIEDIIDAGGLTRRDVSGRVEEAKGGERLRGLNNEEGNTGLGGAELAS